jgi:hypothetical protein
MKKELPGFVKFNSKTKEFSISPKNRDRIGKYTIEIKVSDSFEAYKLY